MLPAFFSQKALKISFDKGFELANILSGLVELSQMDERSGPAIYEFGVGGVDLLHLLAAPETFPVVALDEIDLGHIEQGPSPDVRNHPGLRLIDPAAVVRIPPEFAPRVDESVQKQGDSGVVLEREGVVPRLEGSAALIEQELGLRQVVRGGGDEPYHLYKIRGLE
jgi:hypothetical protein